MAFPESGPVGLTAEELGGSVGLTAGNTGDATVSRPSWLPPAAAYDTFLYADAQTPPPAGNGGTSQSSSTGNKPVVQLSPATNDPFSATLPLNTIYLSPAEYNAYLINGQIYPGAPNPQPENTEQTNINNSGPTPPATAPSEFEPLDTRLVFITDSSSGSETTIMSYTSDPNLVMPLVEGFVYSKNGVSESGAQEPTIVQDVNVTREEIIGDPGLAEFKGVPALMSNMTYIGLIASGGKDNVKYLVDRENQPRWYDATAKHPRKEGDGSNKNISATQDLTVTDLINWSNQTGNKKFPYRYQDFVFLKYWKKIPLNYMITLRRYSRPVIDNVSSQWDSKYEGTKDELKLRSAVHAVTFLGEEAGNKISSILGPIEAGLNWKEIKADVWEVNGGSPAQADSPFPNLARALGFLTKGVDGVKDKESVTPPDPYNNGPYANKIIGPVNVIDRVKARERGIQFKHSINLQFEYVSRSIGGINSKAAMLDIMANLLILTFNSAPFWGGMNRFMPNAGGGTKSPFLGGEKGREAWLQGNPVEFFSAVSEQFLSGLDTISDLFSKLVGDPIETLKSVASKGMENYMKLNTTAGRASSQGLHALLTNTPIGEWHITVGNPMNPIMMIGNLVCSNIKIEFNDELGPDDFPTEIKATITLEHGMPRDKDAIESMFNKGGGRIYSLPPKMKESDLFPSYSQTASTPQTGGFEVGDNLNVLNPTANTLGRNGVGNKTTSSQSGTTWKSSNPLLGDPTVIDKIANIGRNSTLPGVAAFGVAVINSGMAAYDKVKEAVKKK